MLQQKKNFVYNTVLKDKAGKLIEAKTDVTYKYNNMPIMLEEGVGESFTDKKVISEAVDKIVRIGIRNTTYLPILESEKIPFEVEYVDTDELLEGETATLTNGVLGELTKIYRELRDSNTGELLSEKEYVTELN